MLGTAAGSDRYYRPWDRPDASTRVVVVDITDVATPTVEHRLTVPGGLVDARLESGRVVTVTRSGPALRFTPPHGSGPLARRRALVANVEVIDRSTLGDWLPAVRSSDGREWPADCRTAYRPRKESGLGSVSVTSIDPGSDLPGHQVTVFADPGTVYASTDALYLATNDWSDRPFLLRGGPSRDGVRTHLHAFDLTDPDRPTYLGSGSVRGSLLGKYALSEYDGYLRVATTVGFASPAPGEGRPAGRLSNNRVVVLQPRDGRLVRVGHVGQLGRGERIYSVRFLGDTGYVVTFRQTDPLFVLDLSDPTAPALRGELELPGYSSYLHPLGDDLLFGLGQSVDSHLRQQGVQTSVFDVSDPADPRLRDRVTFAGSWSPAENDPHQFLWWPDARLVVVPIDDGAGGRPEAFSDVVLHVSGSGALEEVGRVRHPGERPWDAQIERALVVGDLLYTVSREGVLASDLGSLATQTWLPFH